MKLIKPGISFYIVFSVLAVSISFFLIYSMQNPGSGISGDELAAERTAVLDERISGAFQSEENARLSPGSLRVEITDDAFSKLLSSSTDMPFDNIEVSFKGGGRASFHGEIIKERIDQMMTESGASDLMKLAFSFAPDKAEMDIALKVNLDEDSKHLSLTPEKISFSGVDLDGAMLPQPVLAALNSSLNSYIAQAAGKIDALDCYDGGLKLNIEVK